MAKKRRKQKKKAKGPRLPLRPSEVALQQVLEIVGTKSELARRLGKPRQNIQVWKKIPPEYVPMVAEVTGLPPHVLRPDLPSLFPPPRSIADGEKV